MPNEFISPNWHVVLMHAPLGLVVVGILVELISWISPRGGFRAAGRWMMLLGALLAIPTATAGIYAFRDVVTPTPVDIGEHWQQVVHQSGWLPAQWGFMERHIWYNGTAVALFAAVVILWLAGSDRWRRSAYLPLLILMLAGAGLMIVGAWYGGELVYRYGTGVDLGLAPNVVGQAPDQPACIATAAPAGVVVAAQRDIRYYIPPLQLHMVLAGLAAAFVVGAFGLMIRRWQLDSEAVLPLPPERMPVAPAVTAAGEVTRAERVELRSHGPYGEERVAVAEAPRVYPGWFWLGAFLLAVAAAAAGLWSVMGVFTREAFEHNWREILEADHRRLLLHVIFGDAIVILSLVLAGLVRFARRRRVLAGILGSVVLLLIAGQVWLGTMMTFDGHSGPLLRFAEGAAAAEPAQPAAPASPRGEPVEPPRQPAAPPPPTPSAPPPSQERPAAPPPIAQDSPAATTAPHEELGNGPTPGRRGQDVMQEQNAPADPNGGG